MLAPLQHHENLLAGDTNNSFKNFNSTLSLKEKLLIILLAIHLVSFSQTFTEIDIGISGVFAGSLSWGDYDNDGDLDLLIAEIATGSITASVTPQGGFIVTSIVSGSTFSGSVFLSSGSFFSGSGRDLFDIPFSNLTGDAFQIVSGSVTASVSPNIGFVVTSKDSGSQFTGSLFVSGGISLGSGSVFSGSGANLFDIPKAALTIVP
jgi:hypothetical protein